MPKKLILDCDPGVDDAVALLLAFAAADALELLGVTTLAGNVNAALTARNARVLREIAGREEVPVFAGATRPIMGAAIAAEHFHGASGLGSLAFEEPKAPLAAGRAVDFIIATLMDAAPASVSLAVTGPMTNVALALLVEPQIGRALREIVVMGGAREEGGNITASAEYNIYADPHAAAIVFGLGLPVIALGLDVTHKVRTNPERMARLRASAKARVLAELLGFAEQVELEHAGRAGAPLHDPSVIAYLMAPELFETRPCFIQVETASPLTLGHTAIEFRGAASSPLRWAMDADAQGVFDLLNARLA